MKVQHQNKTQTGLTTDFYFLDDSDNEGAFLSPDANITRLDRFDFIDVKIKNTGDWDISDAYIWN